MLGDVHTVHPPLVPAFTRRQFGLAMYKSPVYTLESLVPHQGARRDGYGGRQAFMAKCYARQPAEQTEGC